MYDLIIVGGGIAGLCAALSVPENARIVVVDKGEAGAGSSPLAQGGLAAAVGPGDSPELHAKDSMLAGAGLCDENVVEDLCEAGPGAIEWLLAMGCVFDRDDDGEIHLAREGGQSVARSVHWRDATGQEIVRGLRAAVGGRNVERIKARASRLLIEDGRCVGVVADREYRGRSTLLATGGAGALWSQTTNPAGATGDGIALGLMAGARLADLEFMQFHPTALDVGPAQRVLLTEALRGHGAILVDRRGKRFIDELAPRHVVAKAILDQELAYLDCRGLADLEAMFPTVVAGARAYGLDPVQDLLPVSPAAHYFIGGVAADTHGRTSIPGLFAAGECAATGMHGANRMAGNSLLEAVVVGRRVGGLTVNEPLPSPSATKAVPEEGLLPTDPAIPGIMWRGAGPIRDEQRLRAAAEELAHLAASPHRALCQAIVRAARARAETRGVHIRADYPQPDEAFARRAFDQPPGPAAY